MPMDDSGQTLDAIRLWWSMDVFVSVEFKSTRNVCAISNADHAAAFVPDRSESALKEIAPQQKNLKIAFTFS